MKLKYFFIFGDLLTFLVNFFQIVFYYIQFFKKYINLDEKIEIYSDSDENENNENISNCEENILNEEFMEYRAEIGCLNLLSCKRFNS